ncbi:RlpA-like protein precursor [mine drainage metagenome]|jgi:rare lipoprotein A|uniref:RlpA-like protein n=1 Tax=mine drainage metagenome TaxID=410659 RepID=A0A1J5QYY9_9ZZZZ
MRTAGPLPLRRARPAWRVVALCGAALLAGCASTPPRPEGAAASGHCWAPAPNLRAAYNRSYTVRGRRYTPLSTADGYDVDGTASWYGWESGSTTAMGTRFDPRAFTAASRQLPLPTCVRVTNLANGRSIDVLVNDRGPFVDSRLMDLSFGAAKALGVTRTGTATVRIVALQDVSAADVQRQAPAPILQPEPAPIAPLPPVAPPTLSAPPTSAPASAAALASAAPAAADAVQPLPPLAPTTVTAIAAAPSAALAPDDEHALDALIARADSAASAPAAPVAAAPGPDAATPTPDVATPTPDTASGVAPRSAQRAQSYLQTGAFTSRERALAERDRLRAAGVGEVDIVPGMVRGETFYRVQIGPLAAERPDPTLVARLAALGLRGYAVVQQ